jgi:peptidoglycan/LPS O-acetylase OafA/YrhL
MYEALVLGVLLAVLILWWILKESGLTMPQASQRIILPAIAVVLITAAFTLYYDWRVTGDPLMVPNQLHRKTYGVPMSFYWQSDMQGGHYRLKAIQDNFDWQKSEYMKRYSLKALIGAEVKMLTRVWRFFVGYQFTLFMLLVPFVAMKNRRLRILLVLCTIALLASLLYPLIQPHYLAPYTGVCMLFILAAMRFVRKWTWHGQPIGAVLVLASLPAAGMQNWTSPREEELTARTLKIDISNQLLRSGGKHLIFVRYAPNHHFYNEWVHNRANIDAAPIVWAQEVDAQSDAAMVRYFADRKIWVIEADKAEAALVTYENVVAMKK